MGCLKIDTRDYLLTLTPRYNFALQNHSGTVDGKYFSGKKGCAGGYAYGFQGQETDDEIYGEGNAVNYKYRMHDPRLGRFFSVDPLAPDYPWNSPYAFSENQVIAFIELEGLEKVSYDEKVNENYKNILKVQSETSVGKQFKEALNLFRVNVLYSTTSEPFEGTSKMFKDLQAFKDYREIYISYKEISLEKFNEAAENNSLVIIRVNEVDINSASNKDDLISETFTLNHEEYHSLRAIQGKDSNDKNASDHEEYFGRYDDSTPDANEVLDLPKYKSTIAYQNYNEIIRIFDEENQ